jgi:hypothetical protein
VLASTERNKRRKGEKLAKKIRKKMLRKKGMEKRR